MVTNTREEIRVGQIAIRFLIGGQASGGSVAMFEFDVPAGVGSVDLKIDAVHPKTVALSTEAWRARD